MGFKKDGIMHDLDLNLILDYQVYPTIFVLVAKIDWNHLDTFQDMFCLFIGRV